MEQLSFTMSAMVGVGVDGGDGVELDDDAKTSYSA